MNTIRVISSISFNTEAFFVATVEKLTKPGKGQILDWCHWVCHQPEVDQKKPHIHFVCKPSKRVDTNALRQTFVEPVDQLIADRLARGEITEVKPEDLKPLGVMPFQATASMRDWLLYAIHDVGYLLEKGITRHVHYERDQVKSTEPDFLLTQWEECNSPLQAMTQRVIDLYTVEQMTYGQILQTCIIPPNMVYYFKTLLENLSEPQIKRKSPWKEPKL